MRTIKDADKRKNEILDTSWRIFAQKGFEQTSISDNRDGGCCKRCYIL